MGPLVTHAGFINGTCYLILSGTSVSCLCGSTGAEAGPQLDQGVALGLSLELETDPPVENYVYAFKALSAQIHLDPKVMGFSRMLSSCLRRISWTWFGSPLSGPVCPQSLVSVGPHSAQGVSDEKMP